MPLATAASTDNQKTSLNNIGGTFTVDVRWQFRWTAGRNQHLARFYSLNPAESGISEHLLRESTYEPDT